MIYRLQNGKQIPSKNSNEIRLSESIAEWKRRTTKQNATPEISGMPMYNSPVEPVPQSNNGFNLSMSQFQKMLELNNPKGYMDKGGRLFDGGGHLSDKDIQEGTDERAIYARRLLHYAVNNPNGFWADTKEAANARGWLKKNAPQQLSSLYHGLDEDFKKTVDKRFIPEDAKAYEYEEGIRSFRDNEGLNFALGALSIPGAIIGGTEAATWLANPANVLKALRFGADLGATEILDRTPAWITGNKENRISTLAGKGNEWLFRKVMPESRFTESVAPWINRIGRFKAYTGLGAAGHLAVNGIESGARALVSHLDNPLGISGIDIDLSHLGEITTPIYEKPLTDRIYSYLGRNVNTPGTGKKLTEEVIRSLPEEQKIIYQSLKDAGVDMSHIDNEDLWRLYQKRIIDADSYAGKINIVYPHSRYAGHKAYGIAGYNNEGDTVGFIEVGKQLHGEESPIEAFRVRFVGNTSGNPDVRMPSYIERERAATAEHGVQRRMTDSAIQLAKDKNVGLNGVISGEDLYSPEKTIKMYEHYPTKKSIGNYGIHRYSNHNPELQDIKNGPVYLLDNPSEASIPTKSFRYVNGFPFEFDPERIDGEQYRILLEDIFKANGGKIHVKPENRGKFTALKKRTGHSASWFKAHGTPRTGWKHLSFTNGSKNT